MIGLIPLMVAVATLQIFEMSETQVDAYLADLNARRPCLGSRITEIAQRSLGTPYANGPLGEGPEGKYDKDPLMDLTRVDCVTFIEQTLALAFCDSYQTAFDRLQKIRYKSGKVDFENRNHFMIADWVVNNTFCRDVSADLGVPTATVSRTISRRGFFDRVQAPDLGRDLPDQDIALTYVPSAAAAEAVKKLPSPAIIVFIGKVDWLFALHCGLFLRDQDGCGQLCHASSKAGKVVTADLAGYIAEQGDRYLGFTAYAIVADKAKEGK